MILAPFLHIYQPPTQFPRVLKKIAVASYTPLVEIFERNPKARATVNICAALTEQLAKHGYTDLLSRLSRLVERGQIEFTGSAAYHPLLTRLPAEEITRQVRLNEEINRKYLGVFKPRGFFPPEMAFSRKVGETVDRLGYDWALIEEVTYPKRGKVRRDAIYRLSGTKLEVLFRSRSLSLAVAFGHINNISDFRRAAAKEGEYSIMAMDGETFGHHRADALDFLDDMYKEFKTVAVSELLTLFPKRLEVEPLECTWAASAKECQHGIAYPRWDNIKSPLHPKQWELYQLALEVVEGCVHQVPGSMLDGEVKGRRSTRKATELSPKQRQWLKARLLFDKALHSDQFWWASHTPFWHPEMVERGARMFLEVIDTVPGVGKDKKKRAKKLYDWITTQGVKLYGDKPIVG